MAILLKNLKIDNKFTAVHCTWTEADLLQEFVEKKGNVCICPLTEGNLGDGFPVIASCLDRVCLGTDCNARIDMCEEMRWLEYGHRLHQSRRGVCTEATSESDLAKLLFRYATKNGAESLNLKVVRGCHLSPPLAVNAVTLDAGIAINREKSRMGLVQISL